MYAFNVSLFELLVWEGIQCVEPALVVYRHVVPLFIPLVAEGPQELALDDVVEGTECTATKHGVISIAKIVRFSGTLSFPNKSMLIVVFLGSAERSKKIGSSVEVYGGVSWEEGAWAINILAIEHGCGIGVIKAA